MTRQEQFKDAAIPMLLLALLSTALAASAARSAPPPDAVALAPDNHRAPAISLQVDIERKSDSALRLRATGQLGDMLKTAVRRAERPPGRER